MCIQLVTYGILVGIYAPDIYQITHKKAAPHCSLSPGKVGFYPSLIAKETKPTVLRALVYI